MRERGGSPSIGSGSSAAKIFGRGGHLAATPRAVSAARPSSASAYSTPGSRFSLPSLSRSGSTAASTPRDVSPAFSYVDDDAHCYSVESQPSKRVPSVYPSLYESKAHEHRYDVSDTFGEEGDDGDGDPSAPIVKQETAEDGDEDEIQDDRDRYPDRDRSQMQGGRARATRERSFEQDDAIEDFSDEFAHQEVPDIGGGVAPGSTFREKVVEPVPRVPLGTYINDKDYVLPRNGKDPESGQMIFSYTQFGLSFVAMTGDSKEGRDLADKEIKSAFGSHNHKVSPMVEPGKWHLTYNPDAKPSYIGFPVLATKHAVVSQRTPSLEIILALTGLASCPLSLSLFSLSLSFSFSLSFSPFLSLSFSPSLSPLLSPLLSLLRLLFLLFLWGLCPPLQTFSSLRRSGQMKLGWATWKVGGFFKVVADPAFDKQQKHYVCRIRVADCENSVGWIGGWASEAEVATMQRDIVKGAVYYVSNLKVSRLDFSPAGIP